MAANQKAGTHHAAKLVSRLDRSPSGLALTEIILETFRLNGRLLEAGDGLTRDLGLSSARWQVLAAIDGQPLTVAEIARRMGLRRQSVQRTVNSLRSDEFVSLRSNPNHRRAKLVAMTDRGHAALEETYRRQVEWVNELAIGLPSEDLTQVLKILSEIRDRLEL
jgi:DNA-binding MarR family transcriptional regulator